MDFDPDGERLATYHGDGGVRLWALGDDRAVPMREWPRVHEGGCNDLRFAPSGDHVVVGFDSAAVAVLGVGDPPQTDPMLLLPFGSRLIEVEFNSSGEWLATASMLAVSLWPFDRTRYPYILRGHAGNVEYVEFSVDGRSLVSQSSDGTVRLWPLEATAGSQVRVLHDWGHPAPTPVGWMTLSPDGRFLVTTCNEDVALVVPLDGSAPRSLGGFDNRVLRAAIGGGGRLVGIPGRSEGRWIVRLWDLEAGTQRDIDLSDLVDATDFHSHVQVTADGRVLAAGSQDSLHEIDPVTGSRTLLSEGAGFFIVGRDDDLVVSRRRRDPVPSVATVHDFAADTAIPLASHGNQVISFALDSSGTVVVTGSRDGIIRVGPITGESPHWLVGHEGTVWAVDVSPDGRWIASGADDGTIRLWPMPDLSRPPLHDLPRDEFLARLGSLINRRVIRDPDDPEAYRIHVDPFPGWATAPEW
jgi:WD40 repeat protein